MSLAFVGELGLIRGMAEAKSSRDRRFRSAVFGFLLGVLAWFASGCGPGDRPVDAGVRDQVLLLANGAEPRGLDPHIVTGVTENRVISAIIEGLINYHPTDDRLPEPGVAEHWESQDNHRVWLFELREDARWTNGDPVTAHDFVYSWKRMLTPELGAEYAEMLYILEKAQAFHQGEITDFSQVGVKALDDHTLEVTLVGPTPYFLQMLKHYSWYPVHPPTIERFGGIAARGAEWTRPENYVGNGPFRLEAWEINRVIRVVKSDVYWDADTVRLREIRFYPIDNAATEESSFLNGQIHATSGLSSDKVPHYRRNRPDILYSEPYLGTYYYRLNVTRPVLDDVRVRRALALSIDRELIVERVTQGGQQPAWGYTPVMFGDYDPPQTLSHDPEAARRLLAEAGYPGGEGFPRLEILFNTLEDHRKIAEAIQEMWRGALGIRVSLRNQEWKVYLETQARLDYDISRAGWIADYVDPITMLDLWTSTSGNNQTGWASDEFDELIQRARRSATQKEHYGLLRQAEKILLDELPVIPIYWYTQLYLIDPRVRGWHPKLLNNRPYKYLWLEQEGA